MFFKKENSSISGVLNTWILVFIVCSQREFALRPWTPCWVLLLGVAYLPLEAAAWSPRPCRPAGAPAQGRYLRSSSSAIRRSLSPSCPRT